MDKKVKRALLKELRKIYSMCPWYDDSEMLFNYLKNRINQLKELK